MLGPNANHKCLACKSPHKVFATDEELQAHYTSEHRTRWYCPRAGCERNYSRRNILVNHMGRAHYGGDIRDPQLHSELKRYGENRKQYINDGTPVVRYVDPPALPYERLMVPEYLNVPPPPFLQQQHLNMIGGAVPLVAGPSTSQQSPLQNIIAPSVPSFQSLQDPGFGAQLSLAQIIAGFSNSQFGSSSSQSVAELLSSQQFLQSFTSSQPQSDPNDSQEGSSAMLRGNFLGSGVAGPSSSQQHQQQEQPHSPLASFLQQSAFQSYQGPQNHQEQYPADERDDEQDGDNQNFTSSQPQSDPNDSQEGSSTMFRENVLRFDLAEPSTSQPQEQLQNQSAGPSSLIQSESSAFQRYPAPHSSQEQQPAPDDDDQHEVFTPSAPKRRRE